MSFEIAAADLWPVPAATPERDRFAYGALLVFLSIFVLAPQSFLPALAPLRLALVAASTAAAAYLLARFMAGVPLTIRAPEIRLAALLFAWATVTVPFSAWRGGAFEVLTGLFARTLIVFFLTANLVSTPSRLRRIAVLLSLLSVPLALTAASEYLHAAAGGARIQGYDAPLTSNPNDLALTLNIMLPLTLALARLPRPPLPRPALGVIAALSALGVVLTFSRGGFLTLAVIGILTVKRLGRQRALEAVLVVAVLLLAVIPLLPSGYLGHLGTITDIQADVTGSAQERWGDMAAATVYTVSHPIVGAGIGMCTLALNALRGTTWRMVHNVYLQIGVELGVPGLVLFVLLLRSAIRSAREARRTAIDAGRSDVAILSDGIVVALAAFVVASIFHPVAYHAYFYLLAALAVAAKSIAGLEETA